MYDAALRDGLVIQRPGSAHALVSFTTQRDGRFPKGTQRCEVKEACESSYGTATLSQERIAWQETLDNHDITPDAIQLRVFFVHTHLAKTVRAQQCAASGILDKYPRHQLPETRLCRFL